MSDMVKISFLGDIMCEYSTFKRMKSEGKTDFSSFFDEMKSKIAQSDYVVGNLETPFAGRQAGYTKSLYSFNTPDDLAEATAGSGIGCVTTANNHCLDRGVEGLLRTLDILDSVGISHTGTYRNRTEWDKVFTTEVKGEKISVISCTGSTNYFSNGIKLKEEEQYMVDLLHPQDMRFYGKAAANTPAWKKFLSKFISAETRIKIKKLRGKPVNKARTDSDYDAERMKPYLDRIAAKIRRAKNDGSFVVVCPHIGGQFNIEPGNCAKYIIEHLFTAGADAVIANHPHVVQHCELRGGGGIHSVLLGQLQYVPELNLLTA